MSLTSFHPFRAKFFSQVPLRTVLIVPFVLQLFAAVSLVGYLSFKNGQKAVEDLASRLNHEITTRIQENLDTYLNAPHQINESNADAIRLGLLEANDLAAWKPFLLEQIKRFDSVNSIVLGTEQKGFIGIEVRENQPLVEMRSDRATGYHLETYAINLEGDRLNLITKSLNYDPRIRPWYQAPLLKKQPTWSDIFTQWDTKTLTLAAVHPVYDLRGNLEAVVNSSLHLIEVGNFLSQLKIGKTGQSFILDRDGMLVATSTHEPLAKMNSETNQIQRIQARESQDALTKATADYLFTHFGQLPYITEPSFLKFKINGDRHYLQVLPLQDDRGLDWLIVVVVPEKDFMEQIRANTRFTIALCVAASMVAIAIGILTARWVTQPILRLNAAASALSRGELDQKIESDRTDELGNLTRAFNHMVVQLQESFTVLEKTNETLEKRVEERTAALQESEEKFAKAFRSSPNAITITSFKDGRHLEVNEAFCQLTGYTPEEAIDRTAIDLKIWVHLEERDRLFQSISQNDLVRNYEFSFRTKSGEVRTGLLSAEKIEVGGQECLLALSSDISDRKQAEEALRQAKEAAEAANRAKSTFLANMSHELRTPLNAILGFAQVMNRTSTLTPDQQENLGIISRSGEHLLSLINQVLDVSKIEAGRTTLHEENFDLYCLLEDLEDMFRLKADDKHLQLVFDRRPEVPHYVRTDEVKLRQVLINLLNNAIKFTQEGGVSTRVGIAKNQSPAISDRELARSPERLTLTFEIEDTGPGITPEEVETLFQAFVQTNSGKASHQGTGLGLVISREFVKLMGGEMTVSSEVGYGTLFKFDITIDVVDASNIETKQPIDRVIALEPNQPRYRILIVDDRWTNRQLMVKLLSPLGFEVREASNGKEAIEIWSSWEPHLIWMDMRMPVMDGYEATQRIKATTKGQATAVIALTASVFEEERAVVLSAGCDDFLRKPFREGDIFEVMHKHLGVRYVYDRATDSLTSAQKQARGHDALKPEVVAALPGELLANLKQAVTRIDMDAIDSYINEIGTYNAALADGLATWSADFKYDEILNLILAADKGAQTDE